MGEILYLQPKITPEMRASLLQQLTDAEMAEPRDWRKVIELRYILGFRAIEGMERDED